MATHAQRMGSGKDMQADAEACEGGHIADPPHGWRVEWGVPMIEVTQATLAAQHGSSLGQEVSKAWCQVHHLYDPATRAPAARGSSSPAHQYPNVYW